jgi:hypothetical protein
MTLLSEKKITDIHTDADQADGVPILAPGIYGLLGGALLAKPAGVAWLESSGYVEIDPEKHVCSFTEAGAIWLDDATDEAMDQYFYRPTSPFDSEDV